MRVFGLEATDTPNQKDDSIVYGSDKEQKYGEKENACYAGKSPRLIEILITEKPDPTVARQ